MYVYFDLNVFDRIEKKTSLEAAEREIYSDLQKIVLEEKIIVPYSNAHLNDLFRGFQKNPNFIEGHLRNIQDLTKNLCVCQYWNREEATWHNRNIFEFFEEKKSEWEFEPQSLDELFKDSGIPNILLPFKLIDLDKSWKQGYSHDPMFGIMFPNARTQNTAYSLMEDIFNFQFRLKSDYSLYKKFRAYLIQSINKLKTNREYLKSIKEQFKGTPKHLDIFELSKLHGPKNNSLKNRNYSNVLDVFYKYDLKGYKSDSDYNSMFDDSLHTFYAAHCDFFITNDDRCKYKAEKTYKRLGVKTIVLKPAECNQILTAYNNGYNS